MTINDNMIVAQSTSNEMTVIFTSDTDVSGSGFVLSYEAVGQENRFDDNCGVNVEVSDGYSSCNRDYVFFRMVAMEHCQVR